MNMDLTDQGVTTLKEDFRSPSLILEHLWQTSALAFVLFTGDTRAVDYRKPRNAEGACSVYLAHVSVFCLRQAYLSISFSNSEKIYTYTDGNC